MKNLNQLFTPSRDKASLKLLAAAILLSVLGTSVGHFNVPGDPDGQPDLLLENANFRFYEIGEAIFVKPGDLVFLLNAAGVDEAQIFRNHTSYKSAYLTRAGLVTKTNQGRGHIFGTFYHDDHDNIFIPFCQDREDDVIATKKSFFENQLIRYTKKLKIDIIIDDYTEAEELQCYRYLLKNIFYQAKKASVSLISLGRKSNEAIIDFVKKLNSYNETTIYEAKATPGTILESLKISEFFPVLQKETLPIATENLIPETLDLWRRATEVKLINNLEEIKRNIEGDLRTNYGKFSYSIYKLHSVRDISVYFPALKAFTIGNVMDYYQRLNKILGVSNNFIMLRKLLIFFKYIKRMNLENNHVQLSRIRLDSAITEIDHFLSRIIQWNAFRNSIFAALAHDNVNVLNLVESSKDGEDLREKLCCSLKICWGTRLYKFEKSDLESIKTNVKIKIECEVDCLWIVASIISFKKISLILESSKCNYNVVRVIAFKEINIDGEILERAKNKLIILSPRWSINKKIVDGNVSSFYEGICDPWLVDPYGHENKSPCSLLKNYPEGVCWSDEGYFTSCVNLLQDESLPRWEKLNIESEPFGRADVKIQRALSNALAIIIYSAQSKNKREVVPILEYGRKNVEDIIGGTKVLTNDVTIPLNYIHAFFFGYIKPVKFRPKPIKNLQTFGEKLRDYVDDLRENDEMYSGVVMMKTHEEVESELKEVIQIFKKITQEVQNVLDTIPKTIAEIIRKIPGNGDDGIDQSVINEISSLLIKYMIFEVPKRHEYLGAAMEWPKEKIAVLIPKAAYAAMQIVINRIKKLAAPFKYEIADDDDTRLKFINKVTMALRLGLLKKYYTKFNATFHYLQVVHRLKCETPFTTPSVGCGHLSDVNKKMKELGQFCSQIKDWGPETDSYEKQPDSRFYEEEPKITLDCKLKFLETYRHMESESQKIDTLPNEKDLGALIRYRAQLEKVYFLLQEESVSYLIPLARGFKERNEAVNYWVVETWYSWRRFLEVYEKEVRNLHKNSRLVGLSRTLTAFKRYVHSPLGDYGRGLLLLPTFKGDGAKYYNVTKNMQEFLSKYARLLISARDALRNEIYEQYLKNINVNKPFESSLPPDTNKMVKTLDKILRKELIENKGEEARIALRQYLFPFPDNVKNYWTREILQVLETITNTTMSEDFEFIQKVKNQQFDPDQCRCPPFFFWPFHKHLECETTKKSFLAGKSSITLKANILIKKKTYEALKGRNFNIRLVPYGNRKSLYWKEDMDEISKALTGTTAELTHEGNAYTIFGNKMYRTLTEPIKIILGSYTDGKFDNSINEIVGSNPLPLSPYSKWTIRLKHINSEQADKLLDISHLISGIELIGDGAFIQPDGNSHKTKGNYEPVTEYEIYDENEADFL